MSDWINLEDGSIDEILLSFCKLWAAVLDQAINDALGIGLQDERRLRRERIMENSREWILSDEEHPGSFRWVCDALNIDPKTKRERIFSKIGITKRPKP